MFEIPDIQLNQYGKPARIMFLAPYAPDAPDFSKKPYTGNGGYPQYHYNMTSSPPPNPIPSNSPRETWTMYSP